MAYAEASDVADRLGRALDEAEQRIVEARLDDVEAILKTRIPDLDEQVQEDRINLRIVEMVEVEAILRLIRNPDGYIQETDGNYSYSLNAQVASGRLQILPEEWRWLGVRQGVSVISPVIELPGNLCTPCNPNADFEWGTPPSSDTAVWG